MTTHITDPLHDSTVLDWIMTCISMTIFFDYIGFVEYYFHTLILVLGVIYWVLRLSEILTGMLISTRIECVLNRVFKKKS